MDIVTLHQALTAYVQDGMPARRLAARTRKEYTKDLTDLVHFLDARGVTRIADVSLRHLEAFQAELDHRGYASSTCNRKTQSVRAFFHFLHTHGITATNLAEKLIPPPIHKQDPRFLSEQEYQRLLRACSHKRRDAAMIELFLQTGMRLSELAKLTLADIDIPKRITLDPENMGYVRVRRKGGKTEYIPLNHKACKAIAAYLAVRPEVDHDALFVSQFKRPMSTRAIQHRLTKYLAEAKISGASVHSLRHTMATHHLIRGTDLKTVQSILGHKDISTTSRYASVVEVAKRKALQEHAL